jgi:hypothetical protein
MRKAWERVRRAVSHPAITFGSNVQFLVGAGLVVAALVSGFLAVLVEFPLVFLILVGCVLNDGRRVADVASECDPTPSRLEDTRLLD